MVTKQLGIWRDDRNYTWSEPEGQETTCSPTVPRQELKKLLQYKGVTEFLYDSSDIRSLPSRANSWFFNTLLRFGTSSVLAVQKLAWYPEYKSGWHVSLSQPVPYVKMPLLQSQDRGSTLTPTLVLVMSSATAQKVSLLFWLFWKSSKDRAPRHKSIRSLILLAWSCWCCFGYIIHGYRTYITFQDSS